MEFLSDSEIIARINILRKEKNAVILAHNYQLGEIQDIADFYGDSLELSIKASKIDADVIVFCGVSFMAETAYILSPEKTVLLPAINAGCDMADMAEAEELKQLKAKHPGALVACYVNSTAAIKAESDICVTSANAVQMIGTLSEDREIIFVPDKNLGRYCAEQTGRKLILWEGYCPVHERISAEQIKRKKAEFPEAEVLIHPEAPAASVALADKVMSTGGMCRYIRETAKTSFIIATELGIIHRLRSDNPDKHFIPVSEQAICPTMKLIRLKDVLNSLENMQHCITVPEEIRKKALIPIERMLKETEKLKNFS